MNQENSNTEYVMIEKTLFNELISFLKDSSMEGNCGAKLFLNKLLKQTS